MRWTLAILMLLVGCVAAFAEDVPYTLNPGDDLIISSFDDETLKRELPVLPDGKVYYPGVGGIMAQGLTPLQLEKAIEDALIEHKILREGSKIDVTVAKVVGNTFFVTGQVKTPGAVTSPSNITVMQAISLAGGLTPFASRGSIRIIRNEGGKQTVFRFNYNRVARGEALKTNITLHAGDTVIVP
ncbi:MAG: polysaccharide biosynthesis/export family protein [Alphaproteobacteria bacterium]